jgi:hypothetical protein
VKEDWRARRLGRTTSVEVSAWRMSVVISSSGEEEEEEEEVDGNFSIFN